MKEDPYRRDWRWASLVLAGCILLAHVAPAWADGPSPDAAETAETVRFLLESISGDRAIPAERALAKLAELGPQAVPALLSAGTETDDPDRVDLIVAALLRIDPESADRLLLRRTDGTGEEPGKRTAFALLGDHGTTSAPAKVVAQMVKNHPRVKRSAELALIRLLRRHDSAPVYRAVEAALEKIDIETRARVICCIGQAESAEAMRLLVRSVGRWPKLDHAVVSGISQMPDVLPAGEVVPGLRRLLEKDDEALKREVAIALGLFRDAESVSVLLEMLGDAPEGLRDNAHWALRQISGLEFPKDEVRWRLWYEEEIAWWKSEGKKLLDTLGTGSVEEILDALRLLARATLFRDRLHPVLTDLLRHPDPRVREATQDLLSTLGFLPKSEAEGITAALVAKGFVPVRTRQTGLPPAPAAPVVAPTGSSSLVPIAGCFVIFALVMRIFGLALLVRIIGFFKPKTTPDGPMTVKLEHRKKQGRFSELSNSVLPGSPPRS